ncbi:MAG: O-antigen ligase family protein [Sphingomonas sp.]
MGEISTHSAPSFPIPILIGVTLLLAGLVILAARRVEGRAARFVILGIWLRYIMSVFHVVTYRQAFAGLSWNALGSIAITGIGLLVILPRHLTFKSLLPVYAIVVLSLFSAALNHDIPAAIDNVVKYGYFCVLMIAVYEALRVNGADRFFPSFLAAFAPLLVFQLLSIVTGVVKASELDGSKSYIGGYNHEAAFSVALATFFIVVGFTPKLYRPIKVVLLVTLFAGILLANYRTTIIAVLPLAMWFSVSGVTLRFRPEQRLFLLLGMSAATLVALVVAGTAASDRFGGLWQFISAPGDYIKPQDQFTLDERRLLSGRAYIWSGYIFAWLNADQVHRLFGFGPDSWSRFFPIYPHNTVIDFLFELGGAGVVTLLAWWGAMLNVARRARGAIRIDLIVAHGSFILLNLATMALWQIEGVILYAIVCGYSLYAMIEGRNRHSQYTRRATISAVNEEVTGGGRLQAR